jgi:hypothetical protein
VVSEAIGAALVPVAYAISGVLVPELLAAADALASLQADVARDAPSWAWPCAPT